MTEKIRILVVDDQPIMRLGLTSYFSQIENITVVGEIGGENELLDKARKSSPHVIMLGVNALDSTTTETVARLHEALPQTGLIVYTLNEDRAFFREMIRAGIRGYLLKTASPEELVQAIEKVHRGETYFSARISNLLVNEYIAEYKRSDKTKLQELTDREREILIMIAEGHSNKDIAARLFISVRTVETHRERIMRKLDIHTAAGLTRYAISKGLVQIHHDV